MLVLPAAGVGFWAPNKDGVWPVAAGAGVPPKSPPVAGLGVVLAGCVPPNKLGWDGFS